MQQQFPSTAWTLVLACGSHRDTHANRALAALCEAYWYPLYGFVRRQGHDAAKAQDLTQEFFARILEAESLRHATPSRGRFRSFLLTSLKHFLANEADRECAQKRGGGQSPLAIDFESAERGYNLEPAHDLTPERLFEKKWAFTVLERVLSGLEHETVARGQAKHFAALRRYLTGDSARVPYSVIAAELNLTEGAVKTAVYRLRQRYGELLRLEIAETVANPAETEDEIRFLLSVLGR